MLRTLANIISVIFHPLYIILYIYGLLLLVNPFQLSSLQGPQKGIFFISLIVTAIIIPIIGILMMRSLGMIGGLEMKNRNDRIGPLILTGICYLWLTINFLKNDQISEFLGMFMLGSTISLFLGFLINLGEKISLHTLGMGGFLAGFCIMIFKYGYDYAIFDFQGTEYYINHMFSLAIIILLCGLVATSRLFLKAHVPREIYGGFLVGMVGQIIALRFI